MASVLTLATVWIEEKNMDKDLQVVEVTVRIWLRAGADPIDAINEAAYAFEHADIVDTDIVDIHTEL